MTDAPMLELYQLKMDLGEYEYLDYMCALTKDENGELVLAGLNLEESIWYMTSNRQWLQDRMTGRHRSRDDREKYLELAERHQMARIQQVIATASDRARDR
ncbi:hypothetical protein U0030_15985 [Brevundimonas bullata]|uniref:hypothetical protein n=1 Tax=Brevundimonas bullata TaxID=13160 RepID=UPI000E0A6A90|nr:hypothetical protein [Brevundimonas bullata]WQE36738.1 hypothetical protein U0030_15985 [Brevundimonas bullata]